MSEYYKLIDGKQYDLELLDLADKAVAGRGDGRISKADAVKLLEATMDADAYTDTEKATLHYIRDNYRFTKAADEWFRTEVRRVAATR